MKRLFKIITLLILLPSMLFTTLFATIDAKESNVIRVGWFDSIFNRIDEHDRRSGYSYEYQQSLAVYTGWKYEYVTGSWSNLLQQLIDGKIDILSDVSYTDERKDKMIYSTLPMGTEDYYLYKSPSNNEISIDNLASFNGKKIGVNKASIMIGQLNSWLEKNNITAEIVELSVPVEEGLRKLNHKEIDLYVSMDGSLKIDDAVPLYKFGSSNFYFAVRKNAPEIATKLDMAMSKLIESNPYYNFLLHSKYFKSSGINLYLSEEEKAFVNQHGKIKVGYQDNYLAFCAKDSNGELTGVLKDYLNLASTCLKNANLEFEAIAYPTAAMALADLKEGKIDCMFPANLSIYDSEQEDLFTTNKIITTEIVAVVPESQQKNFMKKDRITVAVNAGNPNYQYFLIDNFPNWKPVILENTQECLRAINDGRADCLLISNCRFNNLAEKCSEYKLVNLSTGIEMDYYFAVNRNNLTMFSILNKVVNNIPESSVNSAMSYYYTEDTKVDFGDFVNRYFGIIMLIFAIIVIIILALIFLIIWLDRKSRLGRKLIKATEINDITGLYNKVFFVEYANKIYLESPDKMMDVATIIVDHYRSLIDINGEEFTNQLLSEISDEIKSFLKINSGIAGYSDEGRYAMYFSHIDDYQTLYDKIQDRIEMVSPFSNIKIRMGVMPWQKDKKPQELINQAILACNMSRTESKAYLIIFDDKMKEREEKEKRLLSEVRRALDNKELKIYYQPKYNIDNDAIQIIGAEALLRWEHPEYGMIEPKEFIPLFEKNGEIEQIDRFVRKEVVKQIAKWKNDYGYYLPISVNVSKNEVLDQTFEDSINVLMDEYELTRKLLHIEITESAIVDNINQFANVINKIRNYGYRIELDDFGNEYLSLKILSSFNADIIKIDKSLVEDFDKNEKNATLIKLIVGMAKTLNVPVIAEGVETKEQLEILRSMGCTIIQGFYLSKPLLPDEYIKECMKKKN